METAFRIQTTVLPGHRVEVCAPELPEGGSVEVIVLLSGQVAAPRRTILDFLDSLPEGPRSYSSWEEFERGFAKERDAWDR